MASLGAGSTITATIQSAFFTAQITSVEWSGISRTAVPTTTLATTGGKSFIPSTTYDPGELAVEFQYDPSQSAVTAITGAAETVTVVVASTAKGLAASGFLTNIRLGTASDEDLWMGTGTIKFTGSITADTT